MAGLLKYLSFRGRANRQRYWLTVLSILGLWFASVIVVAMLQVAPLLGVVMIPVFLGLVVASLANGARRLHDRNKSAWWLLVFVALPTLLWVPFELTQYGPDSDVPSFAVLLGLLGFLFTIWGLVELGFLKGTPGPNRFGEDPLGAPLEPAIA